MYIFHLFMNNFYKIGFFVLLFLIVVSASYYIGTQYIQKPTETPKPTVAPTIAEEEVTITTQPTSGADQVKDLDTVKETIRAVVETQNTQPLLGYMADSVSVILEATECCGPVTKAEAVKQLEYLNDATAPWNFDQTNDTIKQLKAQEPTKYGPDSAYVGIAANEYTVSFKFDASNKINGITMAVSYKLVLP